MSNSVPKYILLRFVCPQDLEFPFIGQRFETKVLIKDKKLVTLRIICLECVRLHKFPFTFMFYYRPLLPLISKVYLTLVNIN